MIYVIADIEVKSGSREAFLAELHKLVPKVCAEDGCIAYAPAIDADTDIPVQKRKADTVTIMEQWESVAALKAHLQQPHMGEYKKNTESMIADKNIRILQPA